MPSFRCVGCQTVYEERLAWCWHCGGPSLIIPAGRRPPSPLDRHVEVATARDLVRRRWSAVTSTAYPVLRLAPGALVVVYGEPGAGKSTWLARWLDGYPQPVLLAAAEEHVGRAFHPRLTGAHLSFPSW